MVRCDNCFGIAAYTCADPGVNPVNYCTNCLPVWLQERANAGHFPLVEPLSEPVVEEVKEEAPVKKKKKEATSDEDNN
jgi:hypothetical protein